MNGCGKQTHVSGTNGGTMACGATLRNLDGTETREFCGSCQGKGHKPMSTNRYDAAKLADLVGKGDVSSPAIDMTPEDVQALANVFEGNGQSHSEMVAEIESCRMNPEPIESTEAGQDRKSYTDDQDRESYTVKAETKHTPGPWEVSETEYGLEVIGREDRQIARLNSGTDRDCNARLIVAAPDMLQALRECEKHFADILDNCLFPSEGKKELLTLGRKIWRTRIKAWLDSLRAALSKLETV